MKFIFTFRKSKEPPNENHYIVVNAPCVETAVDRLIAHGFRNWSTIYTHAKYVRRQNLTLWREL